MRISALWFQCPWTKRPLRRTSGRNNASSSRLPSPPRPLRTHRCIAAGPPRGRRVGVPKFPDVERLPPARGTSQPATLAWPRATWIQVAGASNRPIERLGRKSQEKGKASWEQPFGKNLDKPILESCSAMNVANQRTCTRSGLRTA